MDYEPTGPSSPVRQRPTCDSYFVEDMDQDDGVFVAQRSKREIAQMHAETQMDIAEELTRNVAEEYQEDILDHMEYMEVSYLVIHWLFQSCLHILE
jgi:hypothetical protein